MRTIFYIPEGEDVENYKEEWYEKTSEVHTGISKNIEQYIDDPSVAQFVNIPEFKHMLAPINASNSEYFQVGYVDDFADRDNLPQYIVEVWSKNLDNPSDPQDKVDNWIMQFDLGANFFHTDHVRLDVGWYDLVVMNENEEIDTHEISIYESYEEE